MINIIFSNYCYLFAVLLKVEQATKRKEHKKSDSVIVSHICQEVIYFSKNRENAVNCRESSFKFMVDGSELRFKESAIIKVSPFWQDFF